MEWANYSRIVYETYKRKEKPYQAYFELTPFCNFSCNMCYIHLSPEQAKKQGTILSTQQWLDIAREAKRMGTIALEVTGGEALTRPDFCILYESFIKMGYLINLRTNGYLIKDDVLELLTKYKPRQVSVTLYGATDSTYKKICGISDGFTVVMRNIQAMRDAGIKLRFTMTVTKDNCDDMKLLNAWAEENNLTIGHYGALITPIRAAKRSIDHLQMEYPDEEYIIPDELRQNDNHVVSDRQYLLNPFWMCRAFGAKFCISWDGRMTICNTFTSIWSEPLKTGLEVTYHKLYADLRKLERPDDCQLCSYIEFCDACPSKVLSATGDPMRISDKICRMARRKYKHYLQHISKMSCDSNPQFADRFDEGGVLDED